VRIRVYLDRTDRVWRVCRAYVKPGASPAAVAAELQRQRAGVGFASWGEAMAAAGRMAAKTRRVGEGIVAAARSWQAQR
jgi:hypothetical protein